MLYILRQNGSFYDLYRDNPEPHEIIYRPDLNDLEDNFWMYTTNSSYWTGDWSESYGGWLSYDMITRHALDPSVWGRTESDANFHAAYIGKNYGPNEGPHAKIHHPTSEIRITGSALDEM
jgi:hypothetical protein